MSTWEAYPNNYRSREVNTVLAAVRAGECAALVGLSGSGKSNLMGFLYQRCNTGNPVFLLVDGNRTRPRTAEGLLALVLRVLNADAKVPPGTDLLVALETAVGCRLEGASGGLCLLLDRFDALDPVEQHSAAGPLRALRDTFKYRLTYVTATRQPLDASCELTELFFAHSLYIGPLAQSDARWSAQSYAERQGLAWSDEVLQSLIELSWGYPALLRACCEAYAQGTVLEAGALLSHTAVRRRIEEFRADQPDPEVLRLSGLEGHPLLMETTSSKEPVRGQGADVQLTALEHRLLVYFQSHSGEVCTKDDLIHAIWPEDRVVEGLRDDSLAQLVRRLRQKTEPVPSHPTRILTVPGRGYRYI